MTGSMTVSSDEHYPGNQAKAVDITVDIKMLLELLQVEFGESVDGPPRQFHSFCKSSAAGFSFDLNKDESTA